MSQSRMTTFFRGRVSFGGLTDQWYARVDTTTDGNSSSIASAISLIARNIAPPSVPSSALIAASALLLQYKPFCDESCKIWVQTPRLRLRHSWSLACATYVVLRDRDDGGLRIGAQLLLHSGRDVRNQRRVRPAQLAICDCAKAKGETETFGSREDDGAWHSQTVGSVEENHSGCVRKRSGGGAEPHRLNTDLLHVSSRA